MPWLLAAAPIVTGLIGKAASAGDEDAAKQAQLKALEAFQGIDVPSVDEQKIILDKLRSAGVLTPQMDAAIQQEQSKMNGVQVDPRLKSAQMAALSQLGQTAHGGLNISDRAAMNDIQNSTAQAERGREDAIMQNMAARGMAGSGNELAQRLMASQAAAQSAQSQGLGVGAQAQQRALEAMSQYGNMAGNMNSQDFGQQSAIAQAQDAINRFNTANRQDVSRFNVGTGNQAQAANLANAQRISDTNTGLNNQQEMYNKSLYQQQFGNQMAKAGGMAGQYGNMASADLARAKNTQDMFAGMGNAVGQAGAGIMSNNNNQNWLDAYGKRTQAIKAAVPGTGSNANYAPGSNAPGPYAPDAYTGTFGPWKE